MKHYWNFILIALLCGVFGLQEFYRGRWELGILSILFFWTGIPAFVAFIEVIVWLFKGEETFNKVYNTTEPVTKQILTD